MPRVSGDELQRDCYYRVTVRSPAQAGFFNACTSLGMWCKGNVGGTFRYRLVFALVVWGVSVFPAAPLERDPQTLTGLGVSSYLSGNLRPERPSLCGAHRLVPRHRLAPRAGNQTISSILKTVPNMTWGNVEAPARPSSGTRRGARRSRSR